MFVLCYESNVYFFLTFSSFFHTKLFTISCLKSDMFKINISFVIGLHGFSHFWMLITKKNQSGKNLVNLFIFFSSKECRLHSPMNIKVVVMSGKHLASILHNWTVFVYQLSKIHKKQTTMTDNIVVFVVYALTSDMFFLLIMD